MLLFPTPSSSLSTVRTILITGATDGIGQHTARRLAADGNVHLLVHGSRNNVGEKLTADLLQRGALSAQYFQADLGDLHQVEQLAQDIIHYLNPASSSSTSTTLPQPPPPPRKLDVLINNAGIFDPPHPAKSAQGYDLTWAVNVLAPFVLTRRLLPLLAAAAAAATGPTSSHPRIITTSSISQSYQLPLSMDELFGMGPLYANQSKSAHVAYSHSKLGDYLLTVQLAKILQRHATKLPFLQRIKCLTMDPGTVNTKMLLAGWGPCGIPVSQADNTYRLATDYGNKQQSGTYHFGGSGSPDAKNEAKLQWLFETLEQCTGCTYQDLDQDKRLLQLLQQQQQQQDH
ncbi:hypothetical protein ACA910_018811 [Epithemia clementina (nom. ined.)]